MDELAVEDDVMGGERGGDVRQFRELCAAVAAGPRVDPPAARAVDVLLGADAVET